MSKDDKNIAYFNGIDAETGEYLIPPQNIDSVGRAIVGLPSEEDEDQFTETLEALDGRPRDRGRGRNL